MRVINRIRSDEVRDRAGIIKQELIQQARVRSDARPRISAEIMEKREEYRSMSFEQRQEKREEIREKLKSERNKNIVRRVHMLIAKLNSAVDRLLVIGSKLETRIEKMEERGIVLTRAKELVSDFKDKAVIADEDIASAEAEITLMISGEITSDTGAKVRTALKTAEESVRAVHKALVEATKAVKANVKTEQETSAEVEEGDEEISNI